MQLHAPRLHRGASSSGALRRAAAAPLPPRRPARGGGGARPGLPPRRVAARVSAPRDATVPDDSVSLSDDYGALLSPEASCPHGSVSAIMRGSRAGDEVLVATPGEALQALIPRLSKVTGLPVVGATGKVVGVISRKDIIKVRQAGGSLQEKVKAHMTAPPITVAADTPVEEAGALMLAQKIRRLPVVDADGKPLGIVSRSDIFAPLMVERYRAYQDKEVAAVVSGEGLSFNWGIKYLYDGECSMCLTLKGVLERNDRAKAIRFVNIADLDYDPMANMGVEFEDAMDTIHAIRPDGGVLQGTAALRSLFDTVGLGWVVGLMESPLLAKLVDLVYEFLSRNRIKISGTMDALVAAKRLSMAKAGVETCGDVDGGCEIEWGELSADEGEGVTHV